MAFEAFTLLEVLISATVSQPRGLVEGLTETEGGASEIKQGCEHSRSTLPISSWTNSIAR